MSIPDPTYILRITHIDNLSIYLQRQAIHAPNFTPDDGLTYRTIHNTDIQSERHERIISCGPCGVLHDYVPFYFGQRSPMLYQLHTGWVEGYDQGQEPIIYVVSSVQAVQKAGQKFVFSDGHGIARFTNWFDDAHDLDKIDWEAVKANVWRDTPDDPDRQRRKQAEFLISEVCDWSLVLAIGVINQRMKLLVNEILEGFPNELNRRVITKPKWYY